MTKTSLARCVERSLHRHRTHQYVMAPNFDFMFEVQASLVGVGTSCIIVPGKALGLKVLLDFLKF